VIGEPPRVVIADDHAPTREEIAFALQHDKSFTVCGEAGDAAGAVAAVIEQRPDVCLLDINMPGSGIAAAREIAARMPQVKVVMLTVSDQDVDLFASLRAGASGYLLKDTHPKRLPRELESVLSGEFALTRRLVGRVVKEFRDPQALRRQTLIAGNDERLTSREWQILDLLRHRLTTAQIASRLVLSPVTVRTHINAVMRKLEVADRAALLRHFPPH
jgi:DNA-binding NarL/FixJ family response regulator